MRAVGQLLILFYLPHRSLVAAMPIQVGNREANVSQHIRRPCEDKVIILFHCQSWGNLTVIKSQTVYQPISSFARSCSFAFSLAKYTRVCHSILISCKKTLPRYIRWFKVGGNRFLARLLVFNAVERHTGVQLWRITKEWNAVRFTKKENTRKIGSYEGSFAFVFHRSSRYLL